MNAQGQAPQRAPHYAGQRGNLTLGFTLLLMALFVLLMVLQPPANTQHVTAQSPDAPDSSATHNIQPVDTLHASAPYFHLRAGMHYAPTP